MKKWIAGIAALAIVGGAALGFNIYQNKTVKTTASDIVKEVTVEKGSVTAGVTESAAVSVESLEQTYDLTLTSTSVSASVESGSQSGGMSSGMGMSMPGGMGGMSMGGGMGSTSVSTSSESGSVALVVDAVCITEGQSVKEGDVLMTITQESIDEARELLTKAVTDAELALKQAQIEESETLLSAQYEYDTRITEGNNAKATYDAAMNEIAQNINDLNSQISDLNSQISACTDDKQRSQLQTQLDSAKSQLASAKSSRTTDELAAKQTYEEALMYYDNAQALYDVAVNDVGTSSEEAEDAVAAAKADLEAFEDYIADGSIRAAYSGTITSVGYASGDTLTADTAIASFADAESITVTVNVTEDDIAAVHLDDTVDISFLSYPGETYSGYVSKIGSSSSSGNSATVSYPVTVVVTSIPETLLTGMTANVTFITKQVQDVLYVTTKAVTTEGTSCYVLRKNADGAEEQVPVKIGFSNGSVAEIEGVSEGDTLLIKGKVN
ncbi:MAG: efflux RND transporter periplasmic adaptor subunit [Oscillospiraceae bacterium]|nr:efflux RND transporter periplasmic adaptor subunit [Oscillospiraceae bacterium]